MVKRRWVLLLLLEIPLRLVMLMGWLEMTEWRCAVVYRAVLRWG